MVISVAYGLKYPMNLLLTNGTSPGAGLSNVTQTGRLIVIVGQMVILLGRIVRLKFKMPDLPNIMTLRHPVCLTVLRVVKLACRVNVYLNLAMVIVCRIKTVVSTFLIFRQLVTKGAMHPVAGAKMGIGQKQPMHRLGIFVTTLPQVQSFLVNVYP